MTHSKHLHAASIYRQAFTHSKHLHTAGFHTQQAFTQRSVYTQQAFTPSKLLPREAFTHSRLSHTGSLYALKPKAHTWYLLRAVFIWYTVNHLECTSRSLGATTRWPAGLPKEIKYTCNCTTLSTLHHNYSSTTLQLQLLHCTTLHPAVVGEVAKATTATATAPKNTTPTTFRSISGFALPSVIHNKQPFL